MEGHRNRLAGISGILGVGLLVGWLAGSTRDVTVIRRDGPTKVATVPSSVLSQANRVRRGRLDLAPSNDLSLRVSALEATEQAKYQGSGRNLFRLVEEAHKVVPAKQESRSLPDPPKVAPAQPEIPLKFFGFSREGQGKRIFLTKNEDVFIASEGDIVDRRYRVVRVTPNSVEVEDMLDGRRQMIFLTQL